MGSEIDKDWCLNMAKREEGDISAGRLAMDPMPNEREQIVNWLREMHTKYHAFASPAVEADYETGKAIAFAEAANAIERGDHLPTERPGK